MLQLVQVVSFGLLLSLLTLNGAESQCYYSQKLEPGQTCYAYNPPYPDYTTGENNCIWEMSSDYNIEIQCDIDMTSSYNCNSASLSIQFANNNAEPVKYCGKGTLVLRGLSNYRNPTMKLNLHINTQGRFLCEIKTSNNSNNNNCDCGWKKGTRIVGGKETGINEYPMMCGLVDLATREIFCGCTIIAERYVLTGAHCTEKRNIAGDTAVVIGEHDVTTNRETNATEIFHLKRCIIHPGYNSKEVAVNDIAVCEIVGNIKFSAEVGPACLPFSHEKDWFENIVTALGWGTLEFGGRTSSTLQKVDLNVIDNSICQEKLNLPTVNESNMCTYTNGKDTCQRDSGGPLLWEDPRTKRCVLEGVTSTGVGCADSTPAVAMAVRPFIKWIEHVTPDAEYCHK